MNTNIIYTIRHETTGKLMDIPASEFDVIRSRSRKWKKVGERTEKPAKKAKSEPEEPATEATE